MSGQWKEKSAYASFKQQQPAPDPGSLDRDPSLVLSAFMKCVLLTCLGILCRRIDEVQSTWRQCRGKGCPELLASWAERMEGKMRN